MLASVWLIGLLFVRFSLKQQFFVSVKRDFTCGGAPFPFIWYDVEWRLLVW